MTALVEARGLSAAYDEAVVVRELDLVVNPGEVVALLGPNGAGKTSTLLGLTGEINRVGGEVLWDGEKRSLPLHRLARKGLAVVPEERSVISSLTTDQNIALGRGCDAARVYALFPELVEMRSRLGRLLSGGEQQMLTVGRALARPTRLLIADELSLGLAPRTVSRILRTIRAAADEGMGALVVEQHVQKILEVADRVYVMTGGRIELEASAGEAKQRLGEIQEHYLTTGSTTRRRA